MFRVKIEISTTTLHLIEVDVPQGSVLGSYSLCSIQLRPTYCGVLIATFADDTAILSTAHNPHIASAKLQRSLKIYRSGLKHGIYGLIKLNPCISRL